MKEDEQYSFLYQLSRSRDTQAAEVEFAIWLSFNQLFNFYNLQLYKMKSAVHMALLIMTIYEYFYPREEKNQASKKKSRSNYTPVDLETATQSNNDKLLLTEPGIRRYNSMKEVDSYPYRFDESDEEQEDQPPNNDDAFTRQDDS